MLHEASNTLLTGLAEDLPVLKSCEEFIRSGNANGAVAELRKLRKRQPGDWRLQYALGNALQAAGREEEAIGAFIATTQIKPDFAMAYVKIGRAFFARGMTDPALFWLRRAVAVDARCDGGLFSLAVAESQVGCRERVAELLNSWVAADPDNPIRHHLATAILGETTPVQPSTEYVTTLFDAYAPRFDESLARLRYCGPRLIAEALTQVGAVPRRAWQVLDAGCGTGLVGEVLKPYASRLVGVDLSQNMLAESARRSIYDELVRADMIAYLQSCPGEHDLIVAADALTYCGELAGFFRASASCLIPGGFVIVVHEAHTEPSAKTGYRLNSSGRYTHHADYVTTCLRDSGFVIRWQSDEPMRYDADRPVPTLLFAAEKTAAV